MNIISKDLHYNRQIHIVFGVIMVSILISLTTLSFHIRQSDEKAFNERAANFVHNMTDLFVSQQLAPLENTFDELRSAITGRNMEEFLHHDKSQRSPLRNKMLEALSLTPNAACLLLADNHGHTNSVPSLPLGNHFDAKLRPWFTNASAGISYTSPYASPHSKRLRITASRVVMDENGVPLGVLAMDIQLDRLANFLRHFTPPFEGELYLVDRAGHVVLHPESGNLFQQRLSPALIRQMGNTADHLYDSQSQTHIYYNGISNPDWFVIYTVSDDTVQEARHQNADVLLIVMVANLLICLLCWGFLRHSLNQMVVEIVAMMRVGRLDTRHPGKQLRQEIQQDRLRIQKAINASTTDALTGLRNRRSFDHDLADYLDSGAPFSFGMIDLDNFKSINDKMGHLMGDTVLKAVAQEGMATVADRASLYRYGGEELAILIPGDDKEAAIALLELWRQKIEARQWREPELIVTFSAGLGAWHQESADQLIERVDQALYRAKSSGKNRVNYAH